MSEPTRTDVELAAYEIVKSAMCGVMRQVENIKRGRRQKHGADDKGDWQKHIEGAMGECAFAKWRNVYWPGKGVISTPDFEGKTEVRTASKDHYSLMLHPDDDDQAQFWLLCGINGRYSVKGWLMGALGKVDELWCDKGNGRPAYFVPQSWLHKP